MIWKVPYVESLLVDLTVARTLKALRSPVVRMLT